MLEETAQTSNAQHSAIHLTHLCGHRCPTKYSNGKRNTQRQTFPRLLDHYLGYSGYDAQQYDGPKDRDRPHNLWEPVPGDHGAHGDFDSRAQRLSPQLWTTTHRGFVTSAGCLLAASAIAELLRRQSD
jgi:hypothetical protein